MIPTTVRPKKKLDITGVIIDGVAFIIAFPLIALWSIMLPALLVMLLSPIVGQNFFIAVPVYVIAWVSVNVMMVWTILKVMQFINEASRSSQKGKRKNDHILVDA